MSSGERDFTRLGELVDRALLQDLQRSEGPFALDLPELDLETTVLNRLAVLEVLCKNQAQTIDSLQKENHRLHNCLTASTLYETTSPDTCQLDGIEYAAHYASAAPSFVAFKGRSHTVDGSAPSRHPTASFIPAVHQHRLTSSKHQAASIYALNSTPALRPLQREEFLAKLPKVVIKGGRVLPIRSCIEAFLKGDETALQTALSQSAPGMQQALADIAVGLKQHAASNAHHISHDRHSRSHLTPGGSHPSSPGTLARPEHGAAPHRHDDGLSAKSYVAGVRLGPEADGGSTEVSLQPPEAADVHRSASDSECSTAGQLSPSAGHDAAMSPMHPCSTAEDAPGCDQLVHYVLRELLG